MNEVKLAPITNREAYIESFSILDEDGVAIDLQAVGAEVLCDMSLPGSEQYTALTVAVANTVVTISLTDSQTRSLCTDKEYHIGCTVEIDGVVSQLFIGTLPVLHGRTR